MTGVQRPRYESRDTRVRVLALLFAGLCVVIALTMAGSGWLVSFLSAHPLRTLAGGASASQPQAPPRPRLQIDAAGDLRELRQREDTALRGYAWIDRTKGTVRIPIERAMDLIAAQHLGAEPSLAATPATPRPSSK